MTMIYDTTRRTEDSRMLAALVSATFLLDALIVFGIGFIPGVSPLEGGPTAMTAAVLTAVLFAVQLVIVVVMARAARASIA
ncbi:hypothetical protein [Plantibacter sp. M259]|uniref:hypothetical protein n=1 Tax=Plantibacter sp. M259 TaxID=2583822 RepID=UPI0011105A43|nr:hypothetical protein [Plantibacter sp. M259]